MDFFNRVSRTRSQRARFTKDRETGIAKNCESIQDLHHQRYIYSCHCLGNSDCECVEHSFRIGSVPIVLRMIAISTNSIDKIATICVIVYPISGVKGHSNSVNVKDNLSFRIVKCERALNH